MFTGIIQGVARIADINDHDAMRSFVIDFPCGFCQGIEPGASISIDGVCLTVTALHSPDRVGFDVILQSLHVTTLGSYHIGSQVNVERAAREGVEIGGHILSGHIDFSTPLLSVRQIEGNKVLRIAVPENHMRYVFAKGYIAVNGASLTISEVDKQALWFEVWLIPETRRMTVFENKQPGDAVNIEIERATQVMVDTVYDCVDRSLGQLKPLLESLLQEKGLTLDSLLQISPPTPAEKPSQTR